jgi:hypothetical protein
MDDKLCSLILHNLNYDETFSLVPEIWHTLYTIVSLWTEQQIVDIYKTNYKMFCYIPPFMYSETVSTLFLEQVCAETPEYANDCQKIVRYVRTKMDALCPSIG